MSLFVMPHRLGFYRLDSDGKGNYLLYKGDKYLLNGNNDKAKKCFEKAKEFGNKDATKRLDQLSSTNSTKNKPSPIRPTQDTIDNVKSTFQPNKLKGSYFPTLNPSNNSIKPPDTQSHIGYTFQDAPSTSVIANIFRNSSNEEEKKMLYRQINNIIKKFDGDFSSTESIQELSVLAAIDDKEIFVAIITRLLDVEKSSSTLSVLTIHGLAVILASTPVDFKNRQGVLSNILESLQDRLVKIRIENNSEELLPLLRALSSLFDVMLCRNMSHLSRTGVFGPIKDQLLLIASDPTVNPEVSFLAQYTIQSLAYIGDDETIPMLIFRQGRLAFGIVLDAASLASQFDLEKFESIYSKILEMSGNIIKLKWYQGLLFVDCLLGSDDLPGLEGFIIKSELNSNEYFMQGVCLRLEQLASSHSNKNVIQGSILFLQDIESNSTGAIRQTASISLARLKTADLQPYSTNINLAPVWDKFWDSDPKSPLLKSVQAAEREVLANQEMQENIKDLAPALKNMDEVNKALMDYYADELKIQRVSGQELSLESCFINLAVVDANAQRENEKDKEEPQSKLFVRPQSYEQVSATNTKESIPPEEILNERKLINGSNGIPKKLLIVGRAGVGKTTLCKKLVHTFQNGYWNDRFETMLWIPLRRLKRYKSRNLEDLLLEKYFYQGAKNNREGLAREFIKSVENGRVLFLLDGLDEFVADTDDPLRRFLASMLKNPNVIVTTRPYGCDKSLLEDLDLELETIGFSQEDVENYVQSVIHNSDESESVIEFIRKTPLIQGLVNIPVQLDLICYSWKELTSAKSTTITRLYNTIVRKLWCMDAIKLGKEIYGEKATNELIEDLSDEEIEEQMATQVEYLGYLAFRGLKDNHTIVFDQDELRSTMRVLRQHKRRTGQPAMQPKLLEEAKRSSVLHSADSTISTGMETWNFIHLTFQEYFAATWLSRYFQAEDQASSSSPQLIDKDDTLLFIRLNKYNPRFEIVWWMVAGLLRGEALESYFRLIQDSPRDLIGSRHAILLAGCYREAFSQLSFNTNNTIQDELHRWLEFEESICIDKYRGSKLAKQCVLHDDIVIKCLDKSKDMYQYILTSLQYHKFLTASIIDRLIHVIRDNKGDKENVALAIKVLGSQSSLSDQPASILVQTLQAESSIREAACEALMNQPKLPETAIASLVDALYNEDSDVRIAAGQSLSGQSTFSEFTTTAILAALQDKVTGVRVAAAHAFCSKSLHPEPVTSALLSCLRDDDPSLRHTSVRALSCQSTLQESVSTAIIAALQAKRQDIGEAVAFTYMKRASLSESAISALISVLQDNESRTCHFVSRALCKQLTLPESAISSLFDIFKSKRRNARKFSIEILGRHFNTMDSVKSLLISAIQDENPDVRSGGIEALGYQSTISDSIVSALLTALQDEVTDVRSAATLTLCNQSTLSEGSIARLTKALQNSHSRIEIAALKILIRQPAISEHYLSYIVKSLHNADQYVRVQAVNAVEKHVKSRELLHSSLANCLSDESAQVRYIAARSIRRLKDKLPDSVITELEKTLKDEQISVRTFAAMSICNQPIIATTLVSAVIASLPFSTDPAELRGIMLNDPKILLQLKDLSKDDIDRLYKYSLFEYSCEHTTLLYLYGDQLHIYTQHEHHESASLSHEEIRKIVSAFVSLQKAVGIDKSSVYLK